MFLTWICRAANAPFNGSRGGIRRIVVIISYDDPSCYEAGRKY